MKPVWIVSARRTPHGRLLGGLARYSAVDLAIAAGRAALANIDPAQVDNVIVGNVIGAGLGMNVARQVGIGTGVPVAAPAYTVNMVCGSGMQAVMLAAQAIQTGTSRMVLCGGTESMSNAPHLLAMRTGRKFGNADCVDSLLHDGLTDAFNREHMGFTAERLADLYSITREEQDRFAAESQRRYAEANAAGHFDAELIEMPPLTSDEPPRADSTFEKLSALKPVFKADGSVTAGNASGLNDGAAMLVVCDAEAGREYGLQPLAVISSMAAIGCEPETMGLGPVHAIRKLTKDPMEFDQIEINEAYAVQVLACVKELGLDPTRVNPDGGAIALGHPIGASGARLLAHMAHRRPENGLATLCIGGGMGVAVTLKQPD
ncbi:MAG TPA: thiolase family protein [Chthoniobacterales bacterium]|nr:thiolase family protein [Chthoniobacterales bacterium]